MPSGMSSASYVPRLLEQLGVVTGVCCEIGLAGWLDAHDERPPT
jgi:hypothetical protein